MAAEELYNFHRVPSPTAGNTVKLKKSGLMQTAAPASDTQMKNGGIIMLTKKN